MSSFSRFVHCLACSSTEYIRILKVCFQYMNLGSLCFVSLAKTSCREMLLMTLNAPVTTWSAELYMNEKLYRWNQGNWTYWDLTGLWWRILPMFMASRSLKASESLRKYPFLFHLFNAFNKPVRGNIQYMLK